MKQKNIYFLTIFILLIIFSCSKEKQNIKKIELKIIELNYGFHNYLENIREKTDSFIIKERNLLDIDVSLDGECKIKGKIIIDSLIVSEIKKYIIPNSENSEMPDTEEKEFGYSGKVLVTKQLVISALYNKQMNYESYIKIRNKIYKAYSEVRNDFAKRKFKNDINQLLNSSNENEYLKGKEVTEIFPIFYTEVVKE